MLDLNKAKHAIQDSDGARPCPGESFEKSRDYHQPMVYRSVGLNSFVKCVSERQNGY